jgi:hypothetical protein
MTISLLAAFYFLAALGLLGLMLWLPALAYHNFFRAVEPYVVEDVDNSDARLIDCGHWYVTLSYAIELLEEEEAQARSELSDMQAAAEPSLDWLDKLCRLCARSVQEMWRWGLVVLTVGVAGCLAFVVLALVPVVRNPQALGDPRPIGDVYVPPGLPAGGMTILVCALAAIATVAVILLPALALAHTTTRRLQDWYRWESDQSLAIPAIQTRLDSLKEQLDMRRRHLAQAMEFEQAKAGGPEL